MKTLLLLRHAKSSWNNPGLSDFERPLNGRGLADAPRMGALLRQEELLPDLIITSAAKRALATARSVGDACGYEGQIEATRTLYMADVQDFLTVITAVPDTAKVVLMVGHNPGVEELLEKLTGHWERMPTAALAQILLPIVSWQNAAEGIEGELIAIWYPKELLGRIDQA